MTRKPNRKPIRRRRSGAVLILVIVLLVLMAVMGITYMATARTDRVSASQNIGNTQAEILVSGLLNLAQSSITADLFNASNDYRYAKSWDSDTDRYSHLDHPVSEGDIHLASRAPVRLGELASPWAAVEYKQGAVVEHAGDFYVRTSDGGASAPPGGGWAPVNASATTPVWPWVSGLGMQFRFGVPEIPDPGVHTTRYLAIPTTKQINGRDYPAMLVPGADPNTAYLAGDADGDGIADSLLFPIPSADSHGITYYGAIRVIDHNSAINASLAVGPGNELVPGDYFPAALDLPALLRSDEDTNRLRDYIGGEGWAAAAAPPPFSTHAEQTWMQLGRMLPSFDAAAMSGMQALAATDMTALGYRSVLARPMQKMLAGATNTERLLQDSLLVSRTAPYLPGQVNLWFDENYNFDGSLRPALRALLVTRNGVLNASPLRTIAPGTSAAPSNRQSVGEVMQDYQGVSLRASVNTGGFPELWRQYWNVMVENPPASLPLERTYPNATTPTKQFREMARWPRGPAGAGIGISIPAPHRPLLRAALAAVNTIDLRDADQDISVRKFSYRGTSDASEYIYTVFGNEPQPFITEVLFRRGLSEADPMADYIGIELFNPTDVTINMAGWRLAYMDRTLAAPDGKAAPLKLVLLGHDPLGELAPGQFIVIQNRAEATVPGSTAPDNPDDPPAPDPQDPPDPDNPADPNPSIIHADVPDLIQAIEKELVLIRPVSASTPALTGGTGAVVQNLDDYAPIDQFDMTEWKGDPSLGDWFHYQRSTQGWECVFPGRYSAYRPGRAGGGPGGPGGPGAPGGPGGPEGPGTGEEPPPVPAQQQQQQDDDEQPLPDDPDFVQQPTAPWRYEDIPLNGRAALPAQVTLGAPNTGRPKTAFTIPLNSRGYLGELNAYPYGGFARDGDILNVPFIGGYRYVINPPGGAMAPEEFWELNAISMDAAHADDADELNKADPADPDNNAEEAVGRFVPLLDPATGEWDISYGWAADVLQYLGVTAPQTDHLPEVPPENTSIQARQALPNLGPVSSNAAFRAGYSARNQGLNLDPAQPLDWKNGWRAAEREGRVPIEGLVNINTAPWRVLAALPLLPADPTAADDNGNGVQDDIEALARAIVKFRSQHGPYRTIFDLNRIPAYSAAELGIVVGSPRFQDALASAAPARKGYFLPDAYIPAYAEKHLALTRISNMITTRSDWYTVYVLVQGWRGQELVAERRSAQVVDRTAVLSPMEQPLNVMSVPQD